MMVYEFHQPLAKSAYFQRLMLVMLVFTGILLWYSSFPFLIQVLCLLTAGFLLYPLIKYGKPQADDQVFSFANSSWQLNGTKYSECQCLINTPFFYLLRLRAESVRPDHLLVFKDQIEAETLRKMQLIWFICRN